MVVDCESGKSDDCKMEDGQLQVTEDRYRKKSFFDMRSLSGSSSSQLFTNSVMNVQEEEEDWIETWRQIGKALDRIFFWTFVVSFFVSTIVVFTYGPSLAKPLNAEMDKLYDVK